MGINDDTFDDGGKNWATFSKFLHFLPGKTQNFEANERTGMKTRTFMIAGKLPVRKTNEKATNEVLANKTGWFY